MSDFDERSGVVYSKAPWGQWGQTIDEVFIEVEVSDRSIRAKDIKCEIKPNSIAVSVGGAEKFKVYIKPPCISGCSSCVIIIIRVVCLLL